MNSPHSSSPISSFLPIHMLLPPPSILLLTLLHSFSLLLLLPYPSTHLLTLPSFPLPAGGGVLRWEFQHPGHLLLPPDLLSAGVPRWHLHDRSASRVAQHFHYHTRFPQRRYNHNYYYTPALLAGVRKVYVADIWHRGEIKRNGRREREEREQKKRKWEKFGGKRNRYIGL